MKRKYVVDAVSISAPDAGNADAFHKEKDYTFLRGLLNL